jgi:hypothetical protein
LVVGLALAVYSYQWISSPRPRAERAEEEQVVMTSRSLLKALLSADSLQLVDPLSPNRTVGKAYVYAEGPGWAVSGFYRRDDDDSWHPYLMTLNKELDLVRLKAKDATLASEAGGDARLEILP